MTTLTEAPRPTEAIITEAESFRSRDPVTIMASQTLTANFVLGRTASAATVAAAAAGAGNTGNGVVTLAGTPFTGAVLPGAYRVTFIEPVTNLGTFIVESPEGQIVGRGFVGTAFAAHVAFTIADGATDFVAGDTFTIAVSAVTFQWGAYDPAAADGRAVPRGILFGPVTTGVGVTAAAVGAIAGSVIVIAQRSLVDGPTLALALLTIALLWKFKKLQEPVVVLAAALLGLALFPLTHA